MAGAARLLVARDFSPETLDGRWADILGAAGMPRGR